jgi:hypothetical protein
MTDMEFREGKIKKEDRKLLLDAFEFLASTDVIEFQTTKSNSSSDITVIKCNIYIYA